MNHVHLRWPASAGREGIWGNQELQKTGDVESRFSDTEKLSQLLTLSIGKFVKEKVLQIHN